MVIKVNGEEFNKLAQRSKCIVDFSATWCGPCQMLAPVLSKVSDSYAEDIKFYTIDIDENSELAAGFEITGVPTMIFFENGHEKDRMVGFAREEELHKWIVKNLK